MLCHGWQISSLLAVSWAALIGFYWWLFGREAPVLRLTEQDCLTVWVLPLQLFPLYSLPPSSWSPPPRPTPFPSFANSLPPQRTTNNKPSVTFNLLTCFPFSLLPSLVLSLSDLLLLLSVPLTTSDVFGFCLRSVTHLSWVLWVLFVGLGCRV